MSWLDDGLPHTAIKPAAVTVAWFLLFVLTAMQLAQPALAAPTQVVAAKNGKIEVRTLQFPTQFSIGALALVGSEFGVGEPTVSEAKEIGLARGTVRVAVAPGQLLMLELNYQAFKMPSVLDKISVDGIDYLKFNSMAMDQKEEGRCDKVLKHLAMFRKLKYLDLTDSDVNDSSITSINCLPNLKGLALTETDINGSCFKSISTKWPALEELAVPRCIFAPEKISDLGKLSALKTLDLRWSHLPSNVGTYLVGCKNLVSLNLSRNSNIDDVSIAAVCQNKSLKKLYVNETALTDQSLKAISTLSGLTVLLIGNTKITNDGIKLLARLGHLHELQIGGTNVTIAGCEVLKGLPLTKLQLPTASTPSQRRSLSIWFPHVRIIEVAGNKLTDDVETLFAPKHD